MFRSWKLHLDSSQLAISMGTCGIQLIRYFKNECDMHLLIDRCLNVVGPTAAFVTGGSCIGFNYPAACSDWNFDLIFVLGASMENTRSMGFCWVPLFLHNVYYILLK
jgi:hypothetical protein